MNGGFGATFRATDDGRSYAFDIFYRKAVFGRNYRIGEGLPTVIERDFCFQPEADRHSALKEALQMTALLR